MRAAHGALMLLLLSPGLAGAEIGDTRSGVLSRRHGPLYQLTRITLSYAEPHIDQPPLSELQHVDVGVAIAPGGLIPPRTGRMNKWGPFGYFEQGGNWTFYAAGIQSLCEQIVKALNKRGLVGVYVAPDARDIDPRSGRDLRPSGRGTLRLVIYTGRVKAPRTFASNPVETPGLRSEPDQEWIAEQSPLKPAAPQTDRDADLIVRARIDDYTARLNRHPARRVDVALTPSAEPGAVYVDYLVLEDRPWQLYSQFSDTGTDQTDEWRQRFGFRHTQLTGRDDILQLDYVTSGFDEVNAALGSYESPLPFGRNLRGRVHGSWSEHTADQLGFQNLTFEGSQWELGGEVIANVYQKGPLFGDVVGGARWKSVEVEDLGFKGETELFLPRLGVRLERYTPTASLSALLDVERNLSGVAGTGDARDDLFKLGRAELDEDWWMLHWNVDLSFYLEPILWPRHWPNPRVPSTATLAHEVFLGVSGQWSFDNRVIPQEQHVLGGLHSVRGYPQALVASDSAFVTRAEYRLHLPRLLRIRSEPLRLPLGGEFRIAPQRVLGRPDWDLIVRAFLDYARAWQSDPLAGEESETLLGAGVGIELVLKSYLSLRLDYGRAYEDTTTGDVDAGDTETHFAATIRY